MTQGAFVRFRASMNIGYDEWHDGVGYEVAVLAEATAAERAEIESLLLSRRVADWRDVEALAALRTPAAEKHLRDAFRHNGIEVALAVLRYAPYLVNDHQREAVLIKAMREAEIFAGLTQVLDEIAAYHPPKVIRALRSAVRNAPGEIAVHLAAMLFHIGGASPHAFDPDEREFFLRFATEDRAERRAAYEALEQRVGAQLDELASL